MSHYKSFQEFRDAISLMQVVYELGYRIDKSKGKKTPSFILKDDHYNEIDRLYIFNPHDNTKANFWRRNPGPGRYQAGDVIQFIKENITSFPENAGARNEVDAINKVCLRLTNTVVDLSKVMGEDAIRYINRPERPFNLEDFEREKGNWKKAMRFFKERGIDEQTAELFKDNFELIRDTKAENKVTWKNLGFPYRRPGEAEIVGYEVRGFGKYKSKSEGTDSSKACWQAYLGSNGAPDRIPVHEIDYLHIAESAYDVMSYVQLHQGRIDFDRSLFISVGGTFTNELMMRLFKEYPQAMPVFHFDNDITGVMYDIRAASIKIGRTLRSTTAQGEVRFNLDGKEFSVPADSLSYTEFIKASGLSADARPKVKIEKAPGDFKDWNEVLQTAMNAEKAEKKPYTPKSQRGTLDNPEPGTEEEPYRFKR